MHTKSGLRVVFKWIDFRPDSVIAEVICLRRSIIIARTTCSMAATCRISFTSVDCKDLLKLGMCTFTRIAYERIMKLIRRIWRLAALEGRKHFGLQTELVRFKLC